MEFDQSFKDEEAEDRAAYRKATERATRDLDQLADSLVAGQPVALSDIPGEAPPNVLTVDEAHAVVAASFAEDHDARVLEATIKRLGDWVDAETGASETPTAPEGGEG
jgi:hypothetical protein